jgi:hypothetical protein
MKRFNVAVIDATDIVGQEVVKILEQDTGATKVPSSFYPATVPSAFVWGENPV